MRATLSTAVLLAALALPLAAQQNGNAHSHDDPDHPAAGGGAMPAGWSVRADRGDASGAAVTQEQGGLHVLIRQDGSYLIKRREGEKTIDVSKGWVTSTAVNKAGAGGSATNLLEVDHKKDPSKFRFLVNGQEVYVTDAKTIRADGDVGLRVNHNLDVRVEGFDVHR